jgi:hypothetical protein
MQDGLFGHSRRKLSFFAREPFTSGCLAATTRKLDEMV